MNWGLKIAFSGLFILIFGALMMWACTEEDAKKGWSYVNVLGIFIMFIGSIIAVWLL